MPTSPQDGPVLIQPVESPVICKPYYEPTRHWDYDRQKYQDARRWGAAVNHWGRLGAWDFAVCRDPQRLPRLLAERR